MVDPVNTPVANQSARKVNSRSAATSFNLFVWWQLLLSLLLPPQHSTCIKDHEQCPVCWYYVSAHMHIASQLPIKRVSFWLCRSMRESDRSRLAVSMSSCFLAQSGLPTHRCAPSMTLKACTGAMDDRAFSTYTQFFGNIHQ